MPHIRGQSRLQPLLSRRPQVQSTWKMRRPRLAGCQFLATPRFLTFWTSPLDSVGYFQMQPWTDLSHSTLISTIIIMHQPIQQYPHSHTCKSSKLCTGLPAYRVVTSVNSLDWSLITFSFWISLRVGARDGYTIKISSRFRWKSEQFSIVVGSRYKKLCVFLLFRVVQNLLYFDYKLGIKAKPHLLLHIFHDTSLGDPTWKPLPLRGRAFHAGRLVKYHGKYATTMWFCFNIIWHDQPTAKIEINVGYIVFPFQTSVISWNE